MDAPIDTKALREAALPEAFVTTTTGGGECFVKINCQTLSDMHRWHDAVLDRLRTEAEPMRVTDARVKRAIAAGEAAYDALPYSSTLSAFDPRVVRAALEAATALTTLRERVATEAERAFRDGLAYGNNVEPGDGDFNAYADEAWRTSQARARLKGLGVWG